MRALLFRLSRESTGRAPSGMIYRRGRDPRKPRRLPLLRRWPKNKLLNRNADGATRSADDEAMAGKRGPAGPLQPALFPGPVVTDLLNLNVPLEDVQYLTEHSSPTKARVYDGRRRATRDIVERISIQA
jgi:hypothetical protein